MKRLIGWRIGWARLRPCLARCAPPAGRPARCRRGRECGGNSMACVPAGICDRMASAPVAKTMTVQFVATASTCGVSIVAAIRSATCGAKRWTPAFMIGRKSGKRETTPSFDIGVEGGQRLPGFLRRDEADRDDLGVREQSRHLALTIDESDGKVGRRAAHERRVAALHGCKCQRLHRRALAEPGGNGAGITGCRLRKSPTMTTDVRRPRLER